MESKRIKELRRQLALSQERFAQLLGVSWQTVRRWENGLTKPLPIISVRLEELQRETSKAQHRTGGIPMAERGKRPAEGVEFGFGGLFKGIGNLLDLATKMAEEGKEGYSDSGEFEALGGRAKGVYGFSVRLGLGGKPVVEHFGNIRETETGPVVAETREPLVDVLDEGDRLVVIAELPGVEQDNIHLEVKDDVLALTAEAKDRRYDKEILLPSPVDADTLESSYRNGVLEIKLAKKK